MCYYSLMYTKTLSHTNSNYVIVFNVHVQEIVPYTEILDRSSSWSFATTPLRNTHLTSLPLAHS